MGMTKNNLNIKVGRGGGGVRGLGRRATRGRGGGDVETVMGRGVGEV